MVMRRRSRRARIWNMGILFLLYTCITIYKANGDTEQIPDDTILNEQDIDPEQENTEDKKLQGEYLSTSEINLKDGFSTIASDYITLSNIELNATKPTYLNIHGKPTWRPKRFNCTPPALEQFPRPLMSPNVRRHGGLIIHVLVAVFTFFGLAIVCDDYFVASLDRLCEELKLSPDVAGATFMAAGSSAPELATVIIGVFFAKDDIGISGVIGSAVFNIMFVISVCALCSGTVCQLNWWPIVRDCFFYCISILIMFIVICNDVISWMEALIMLLFYVVYCIALHFNSSLERWALSLNLPIKLPTKEEQSALVTYKNIPDTSYTQTNNQQVTSLSQDPSQQPQQPTNQYDQTNEYQGYTDTNSTWDPNAAWGSEQSAAPVPVQSSMGIGMGTMGQQPPPPTDDWGMSQWNQNEGQQNLAYNYGDQTDQVQQNTDTNKPTSTNPGTVVTGQPMQQEFYKSKDPKGLEPKRNPLDRPTTGGLFKLISWYTVYPIHYTCRLTMPDCRTEKYRNWYPFTFIISMVWISFYSYFMVWMITIIGSTLGIPDTVMGLTFVAAGVSVPDALSSIAVIKEGYGDMAVSNAIGSNVFDILVCLGLPWFIQTAIIVPGSHVNVISKGLVYSTLSLLSTVVFLLFSTHLNGWKLDKRLGIILMIWYLLFITVAALYEMNVFGQMTPPACSSVY